MKILRQTLLMLAFLLPVAMLNAQVDYLARVREFLDDGNCEGARSYYGLALKNGIPADKLLEQRMEECEEPEEISDDESDLVFKVNNVSFRMKLVEGGKFKMGSNEKEALDNEKPVHSVEITSFYMGETEVTQALWEAVMGTNPSYFKGSKLPVERVSWNDCQKFIRILDSITGKSFRLPTEAEWEFAARGGNESNGYKYAGSDNLDKVAWYWKNSGDVMLYGTDKDWSWDQVTSNNGKTHRVKTKRPNELGLYDMSGNVWEWCSDWYGTYKENSGTYTHMTAINGEIVSYEKGPAPQINPKGPSSGTSHVLRGGCWSRNGNYCRVSYRHCVDNSGWINLTGFRLALSKY